MDSLEILQEALPALKRAWELESPPRATAGEIIALIAGRIREWLRGDFEHLVNVMYRLDVAEAQFHQALDLPTEEERADAIARLVLERELQKAATRLHYKNKS